MLYVVSGPSGCGKSTLIRRLLNEIKTVHFSVSHTTRPKRSMELFGKDYYFITAEEFRRMVQERAFVEWAEVHGHLYGTSQKEIETKLSQGDVVLDIDVQGARLIKATYPQGVFIFVLPSRLEELRRRLEIRGENSPESIGQRLAAAKAEVEAYAEYDYIVVNDLLEKATQELRSIILCGKCRREARMEEINAILLSYRRGG